MGEVTAKLDEGKTSQGDGDGGQKEGEWDSASCNTGSEGTVESHGCGRSHNADGERDGFHEGEFAAERAFLLLHIVTSCIVWHGLERQFAYGCELKLGSNPFRQLAILGFP